MVQEHRHRLNKGFIGLRFLDHLAAGESVFRDF